MLWDPEVESPASIAIVGAGSVGIEAALYARFLGYDVDLYDVGRPARAATRWNQRSMEVAVVECTTSLGHAALVAQDENYRRPDSNVVWNGQQYADEYLTPVAKSDLLHDFVHINSPIIEISRCRSSLEQLPGSGFHDRTRQSEAANRPPSSSLREALQERCNDEFRLVVRSRDRGDYTTRADIIIDCRGHYSSVCGWGPSGGQSIGASQVEEFVHRWLPGDARFELRMVEGKQTLLFGQSEQAKRFAREWVELCGSHDGDFKLIWIIPTISESMDQDVQQLAEELSKQVSSSKRFSSMTTLGIDRIQRTESGVWRLQLLQADDSTIEMTGDLFAPFPCSRPTVAIGSDLLSQSLPVDWHLGDASMMPASDSELAAANFFYDDYPGWSVATREPHYYRLGSWHYPHHARGLVESYGQIRDLFALLGTRRDLDLYKHFDQQA